MRFTTRRLAPLAAAACALLTPAGASATSSAKQIKAAKTQAIAYLRSQQQVDGSFPGFGGEWALSALAATKVAPADVKKTPSSTDARSSYENLIGDPTTWPGGEPAVTTYENAALAAYAAGIDPARVSRQQNLIAQIAARYDTAAPGYYGPPSAFSPTVFALLAFADTNTTGKPRVPQALLEQSIEVLRRNQHTDGGWTYQRAEANESALKSPSEPDETGAAIAALCAAGVPSSDPAIADASSYLRADLKAQANGNGAFATAFGPNTDSTAWAVQGLDTCGIDPQGAQFTTTKGKTPIDFLISQQRSSGGFVYEPGESSPNPYSSQDAVRALAGAGFTAAPVKPSSGAKILKQAEFSASAGVASVLTLVIDAGTSPLKACAVSIAPGAAKTTLASVLGAAENASTPSGCVTSFLPAEGKGAITQINGAPGTPSESWLVSIDGGKEKLAKLGAAVRLGDTIYLRSTAAPTEVNVRIEGQSETLFEGPIQAEGHDVQASSDTQPRPCDGTNNGQHPTPGPTPTSASADAMALIGESFDGEWYAGFDDYFITRWASDAQSNATAAYWGVLVNNVFTSVGGCQYELSRGNEVMWVYNGFAGRPILSLYAGGYSGPGQPLTAKAELGKPFEVEVGNASNGQEGTPSESLERGPFSPVQGADVSPVQTDAKGFEEVLVGDPATVVTDAQGKASVTFAEPGWHRIKATIPGASAGSEETAVRSNRLDVCVPASGQSGCGAAPAEDEVRVPPHGEG